jgi:hypothetical protein
MGCLQSLELDEARAIKFEICKMYLASVAILSAIRAERNSRNDPISRRLPPVILLELAAEAARCFSENLLEKFNY